MHPDIWLRIISDFVNGVPDLILAAVYAFTHPHAIAGALYRNDFYGRPR